MIKNVVAVIDGAAGSCGKAKVIGELVTDKNNNIGASIANCMPNAGHTFVRENGEKYVFSNIPTSIINPNVELFIGPGSAIDMESFIKEYNEVKHLLKGRKIYVHERVPLIDERHKIYEKENIKSGSTFKGCGAVSMEKIIRYPFLDFFKNYGDCVVCNEDEWLDLLYKHLENKDEYVLLEGSQGCDLCLNHSGNYPYVTSRNISTSQLAADSGISPERVLGTIMVIRPFPIRISNITKDGKIIYTGAYGTGAELTWSQINIASMYGGYPFNGDIDCYKSHINLSHLKKLVAHCPEVYLKQIFGANFRAKEIEEITLLEALETERLVYKSRGISEYETQLLDLGLYDDEHVPNTIIDQSEQTTVTKMERRIFDLDIKKLKNNIRINTPYGLYLNFFEHLGLEYKGLKDNFDNVYFNHYIRNYLEWLEETLRVKLLALGTGEKNNERILKKKLLRDIKIEY